MPLTIVGEMRFVLAIAVRLGLGLAIIAAVIDPAASAAADNAPQIVVFGDSLAAGHGLPESAGFPAQLQARLKAEGIEARVVDAGVSGDTTAGGLARLDWTLADKPALVILELGANDALRGIDPKRTRANLDAIIGKIQASGAKLLLAGMKAPSNWGEAYQHRFDRLYPELAHAHGVALYPFFLDGVAMDPALNQPDGLHPNQRGVDIVVERILPYVVRLIGGPS